MKTCKEKMAELEERFADELAAGKKDVELTWPDGGKAHCMRVAWVLVKSTDEKFFIVEQLEAPFVDGPAYRFGYYVLNSDGIWSRPQANPMFGADDWGNILAALIKAGMLNGRIVTMFG